MSDNDPKKGQGDATRVAHTGRGGSRHHGVVNPPVYHVSTVTFPTLKALKEATEGPQSDQAVTYGRRGTPTHFALQDAIAALEGSGSTFLVPSGLAAISVSLLSVLNPGDHLLMVDSAYAPARHFCDTVLRTLAIETTYYDPAIGADISKLIRPNTRAVFLESPGSVTFEIQDVSGITMAAHVHRIATLMDNTWATPLYFKPLAHGVDISIQSITKCIGGHADVMMGSITASEPWLSRVRHWVHQLGLCVGPDDASLALRGLRTLDARLARHQATGIKIAEWLLSRREVARVLHPALVSYPGHGVWERDFTGASGLFGVLLKSCTDQQLADFIDGLELFGKGYSWGGYESLIVPHDPRGIRTAVPWKANGQLIRIHAGLEEADDLIADLSAGLARLAR
jgi:cystathionine beta-lyase